MWYAYDMELMDTASAARLLGVSQHRVRELAAGGSLGGRQVSGRWLLNESAVKARIANVPARPYSERMAWGLLCFLDRRCDVPLSRSELARVERRLLAPPTEMVR